MNDRHGAPVSDLRPYFDRCASARDYWKTRNRYYHKELTRLLARLVPRNLKILEIGCGTGDLLEALTPSRAVGLDFSKKMLELARKRHPQFEFVEGDALDLPIKETFDAVVLSDLIGSLSDVWQAFRELKKITDRDSQVVITYYNYLWEPLLQFGEKIGLKMPHPRQNWLPLQDIENFLELADFEIVKQGTHLLLPINVPVFSWLVNRYIAPLPGVRSLCLLMYVVARPKPHPKDYSVTVVVPCRNEAGNIDSLLERLPALGTRTEVIFVDGRSTDGTPDRIKDAIERYRGKKEIRLLHQEDPKGKADAVHIGFRHAQGDVLMILDADITVRPEDLPKFYLVLAEGKGQFVNGSRLVYPMADHAMRFLNLLGNKFFSLLMSWLLGQQVRDTLCGTKVFFRKDYAGIMSIRDKIGAIDPFGDFELLFGASDRNLKIVELPVRYGDRIYGETKISRFRHGFQLLSMCSVICRKLKLP